MIGRLPLAGRPAETRFFLFVGGFGLVLAAAYWVLTAELAGTVLLGGFGLGALLVGIALLVTRRGAGLSVPADPGPNPFAEESGRLPGETLAPLALGLGISLAVTALVFGPWLVAAGIVPLAWGAWTWLAGARDELDAAVAAERAATPADERAAAVGSGSVEQQPRDL